MDYGQGVLAQPWARGARGPKPGPGTATPRPGWPALAMSHEPISRIHEATKQFIQISIKRRNANGLLITLENRGTVFRGGWGERIGRMFGTFGDRAIPIFFNL